MKIYFEMIFLLSLIEGGKGNEKYVNITSFRSINVFKIFSSFEFGAIYIMILFLEKLKENVFKLNLVLNNVKL